MRLEHLRITAFGPFADTVEVDFAELSAAGLFLLTGATGAGKSSVLDAVCFALYGVVPGDRSEAHHLRSDHAAPGVAPEVELRATIRGRTLLLRRSPAWQRPKRRGSGTTRQQPSVCIEEQVDGAWQPLTTRMDEAGHLVTELLGMTATQFTQVAMLPQGRFQAFLRASSAERHAVLQRLFRTDRFERIEQWLAEQRRRLRRASDAHADSVSALLQRISEVAGVPLPEEVADTSAVGSDAVLSGWASDRVVAAGTEIAETRSRADHAVALHEAAQHAHQVAQATHRHHQRASEARQSLARVEAGAAEARAQQEALSRHRHAAPLRGLLARTEQAELDTRAAEQRLATLVREAEVDEAALASLRGLLESAVAEVASAEAALPVEQRHRDAQHALQMREQAKAVASSEVARLDAELTDLPGTVAQLAAQHQTAEQAQARVAGLRSEVELAATGLAAAQQVADLTEAEVDARDELRARVDAAQQLREQHLTARETRISAMAGELASALASGCSCPVCGSLDHPHPAPEGHFDGKAAEEAAQRAYETAETARLVATEALAGINARLDAARTAAKGVGVDEWQDRLDRAQAALVAAEESAASVADLAADLVAAQDRLALAQAALTTAHTDLANAAAAHDAAQQLHADLAIEVDHARGSFADVAARLASATQRCTKVRALVDAHETVEQQRGQLEGLQEDLATAAASAGFATGAEAAEALLDDPEVEQIETLLQEQDRRAAAARAVLEDPEVRAVLDLPAPDLSRLAADMDSATTRLREADEAHARALRAHARLEALATELTASLSAWAPVRDAWRVAAEVSALAEGTSADNALRMRLSAYVLSERLRQVVAAANSRLAQMTDSRYRLEHTDTRTVGARRGGLGLWIRDDWTGARRDPATLSGGETFVVSLALALGLADTVTHEAGGTEIDTLFIDEGFGSLDQDTLDDVMGTLDSLREGGRVVGVVSHVPEMRERIPAGIDVVKARHGSRLALRQVS